MTINPIEPIMPDHQPSTDAPCCSCQPGSNTHAKVFGETLGAFTTTLQSIFRLACKLVLVTWTLVKVAVLRFWEIKGRCWWTQAWKFIKQGVRAVKNDAFNA
jgi:hypothetical protein